MDKQASEQVKPRSRTLKRYVYVVTYAYDYEGHSLEAVYASQKLADQHPKSGDETVVHKMRVIGAKRKP